MIVFIVGLRRSGTTAFWKTLKQDKRFFSLDEPFNPKLIELPKEHEKNVRKEFIELLSNDKKKFWDAFSPIYPIQELEFGLKKEQIEYLRYLIEFKNKILIDTTRCHFKIEDLKNEKEQKELETSIRTRMDNITTEKEHAFVVYEIESSKIFLSDKFYAELPANLKVA